MLPATGHSYVDGTCTGCGEAEVIVHPFEEDGGNAASLSDDGESLNCYQLGTEAIFYNTYFTEKPAEGWFGIREYNGTFYYTSSPSWGVIPLDGYTISGKTLQLNLLSFDESDSEAEAIVLELISETQYKVISSDHLSICEGMIFDFSDDVCAIMGHNASVKCEEDVVCYACEKVLCAGFGHEFGDGDICFRCYAVERPEEPEEVKTLAQMLEEASALANNTYLDYATSIEGVVTEIKYAYSEQYGNISFYVNVDGTSVYCYRVKGEGMDTLALGDTVKVEGFLTAYNGTAQFDKTATVTVTAKNEVNTEKTLAQMLEEASALANNTYLDYTTSIEGVVTEIKYAYSEQYGNISFYVNVDGTSVYCYRVKGEGMDTLAVGDTVKVEGFLTAYNGTAQFDKTAAVTVIAKASIAE